MKTTIGLLALATTCLAHPRVSPTSSRAELYLDAREATMNKMAAMAFDGPSSALSPDEQVVDEWMVSLRDEYIINGRATHNFAPTTFFHDVYAKLGSGV